MLMSSMLANRPSPVSGKLAVGVALWCAVVLAGTGLMMRYSETPGDAGSPPGKWPAASHTPRGTAGLTLVMFVHPHCPCSAASIDELERLMARCQGRIHTQVWFLQPEGKDQTWTETDLWRKAVAIPGVTVNCDADGAEARLFHAATSGQTLCYAGDGSLVFQGGITSARGHSGDNDGRSALMALAERGLASRTQTPVFGCTLFDTACKTQSTP